MPAVTSDLQVLATSVDEPERFAAIFDRHHVAVHNYVRRRLGDELADSLLSEIFTQAFRARTRYTPTADSARPWLFGIASHLIANHRRAERRRLAALKRDSNRREHANGEHADDVVNRATAQALTAQLADGLAALKTRDREVLLLHAWGELSYAEIAEALDVPIGTVRSRLNRARAQMHRRLTQTTADPRRLASTAALLEDQHAH